MPDSVTPMPALPSESLEPGVVSGATPTMQVNPSKVQAVAISMALALAATAGGATTLLHFAQDRNIAGIVAYVQSSEGLVFFSGAATLIGLVGIGVRTARRKAREIYLAYHVRDRIATITKPIAPPPPA